MKNASVITLSIIFVFIAGFTTSKYSIGDEAAKPEYLIIVNYKTHSASIDIGDNSKSFDLNNEIHRAEFEASLLALQLRGTKTIEAGGGTFQVLKR